MSKSIESSGSTADTASPEAWCNDAAAKIKGVFAERAAFKEALARKNRAEWEARCVAPEGFLLRLIVTKNGALTRIHDGHKPDPWYEDLREGRIVYAPQIACDCKDGYTTSTFTSWINGPVGYVFGMDGYSSVRINDDNFELDLISLEEYSERRFSGDKSLFRAPAEAGAQA